MKLICVIGHRGAGKTYLTQNSILKRVKNSVVWDQNPGDNYDGRYINIGDPIKGPCKFRPDKASFWEFIEFIETQKNFTLVIEDATIYLTGAVQNEKLRKVIIGARHRNVTLVFLFHAIDVVPPFIMQQANFVILGKTSERPEAFKKYRLPELEKGYKALRQKAKKENYPFVTIKLQ